jgi:apolipoprotein N-acyltransferase
VRIVYGFFGGIFVVLVALTAWWSPQIREGLMFFAGFVFFGGLFFWVGPKFVAFCDDFKERLTEATIGGTDK